MRGRVSSVLVEQAVSPGGFACWAAHRPAGSPNTNVGHPSSFDNTTCKPHERPKKANLWL